MYQSATLSFEYKYIWTCYTGLQNYISTSMGHQVESRETKDDSEKYVHS